MYIFRYAPRLRSFVPKFHTMDRPWTAPYWAKHNPGAKGVNAHVFYPVVEPIKVSWFRLRFHVFLKLFVLAFHFYRIRMVQGHHDNNSFLLSVIK